MTPDWKQWEGRTIDGRFRLQRCLHSGTWEGLSSAVFLTEQDHERVAIRLVAVVKSGDALQKRWNQTARLAHPNLAKIRAAGTCRIDGAEFAFVVTDYADEILGDVLKERALDVAETRQMLEPVLAAVTYLHANGYAHGRLTPSNLLAVGDTLKLSAESVRRVGEAGSEATTAGDAFALGMTIVGSLTQRQPDFQDGRFDEPLLPEMPAPFLEIARRCLHKNPLARWTVEQVAMRLRESPRSSRAPVAAISRGIRLASVRLVVGVLFVMALVAAVVYSKWLKPTDAGSSAPAVAEKKAPEQAAPAKTAEAPPPVTTERPLTRAEKRAQQRAEKAEKLARERREREEKQAAAAAEAAAAKQKAAEAQKQRATEAQKQKAGAAPPTAAPVATAPARSTPGASEAEANAAPLPPGIVKRVVPEVTPQARSTINGKVKTSIRVSADAAGNVSGASIDTPGSSLYFAGLALGAVRKWQFAPAEGDTGREWIIHFEFTRERTGVNPVRVAK